MPRSNNGTSMSWAEKLRSKFVIGGGAILDWAMAAWAEAVPEVELHPVVLSQNASYLFDLSAVDSLAPADASAFVAYDDQFLNFRRFELMGQCKARGFSMPALISRGTHISSSATIAENVLVHPGAIIGWGCQIDFNAVIGAGAIIGNGARIGSSAWIAPGVVVGHHAKIGANTTLGHGVIIGDAVIIGKLCIVDRPGKIVRDMAPKTFIHGTFDTPIIVVE